MEPPDVELHRMRTSWKRRDVTHNVVMGGGGSGGGELAFPKMQFHGDDPDGERPVMRFRK